MKTIKVAVQRVRSIIQKRMVLVIGKIRMNLGIKGALAIHKFMAKKYLDKNNKEVRNYIVLLELSVRKKNKMQKMERLHWVNRNNFRKLKRKGWLPVRMQLDELRNKAFYVSDVKRTYQQEFAAREKATKRYLEYLKAI